MVRSKRHLLGNETSPARIRWDRLTLSKPSLQLLCTEQCNSLPFPLLQPVNIRYLGTTLD
nr:hypothetical protein Q903MT_gene4553 [Picea sitchensis]